MADTGQIISLEQAIQQLNNIARVLSSIYQGFSSALYVDQPSVGTNLAGTGATTVFTATQTCRVVGIVVSARDGAASVADIDWLDDSGTLTINLVENGVVGANYPLQYLGPPLTLEVDDTIVVTGASNEDVTVSWQLPVV